MHVVHIISFRCRLNLDVISSLHSAISIHKVFKSRTNYYIPRKK
nr:MAG TPA: hypothetical protein [Caudoviricetes sp.]